MAAPPALSAQQLAQQPEFVSDLAVIDAALAAQRVGAPVSRLPLPNQAADRLAGSIMQALEAVPQPMEAVPEPLVPATTAVLRFWLPHIPAVAPAARLCPEVQAVLRPGTRAAVGAHLSTLASRGEAAEAGHGPRQTAASPTMLVTLPLEMFVPGSQPPFGKACRVAAQKGVLLMGGLPAQEEVPGVSGAGGLPRLLDLQTLTFALATIEGQLPHSSMPPLALTLLGEGGFECAAACGLPCLEPAHCVLRPAAAGATHAPTGP